MSKKNNEIKLINNVVSSNKEVDNNSLFENVVEGMVSGATAILKIQQLPIMADLKAAVMYEAVDSIFRAVRDFEDYLKARENSKHKSF